MYGGYGGGGDLAQQYDNYGNYSEQQQVFMINDGYNHTAAVANSSWVPSPPKSNSFANIALSGYSTTQSFANNAAATTTRTNSRLTAAQIPTIAIPQDLWNPHENRNATAFYIADPLERYYAVTSEQHYPQRDDVIDLHFQSLKTFPVVLDTVLPEKLARLPQVWIVTGTGHHVGSRTHQKGGGALESAVLDYLLLLLAENDDAAENRNNYTVFRGRDRAGQGGALLVKKRR
jgi:hypothetical protein